jgi:hypothetical protein
VVRGLPEIFAKETAPMVRHQRPDPIRTPGLARRLRRRFEVELLEDRVVPAAGAELFNISEAYDFTTDAGWQRPLVADFNNDSLDDLAHFHVASASWYVLLAESDGTGFSGAGFWYDFTTDAGWEQALTGDFNADGFDDIAQFHVADAAWYVLLGQSDGDGFTGGGFWYDFSTNTGWGQAVVGDFDADGFDDIAQFYPNGGEWYLLQGGSSAFTGAGFVVDFTTNVGWGQAVVGDFDADGADDIAQFYPDGGQWYVLLGDEANNDFIGAGFWEDFTTDSGWGRAVVGDFDADGLDDVAQFYPGPNEWFVLLSTGTEFNNSVWTRLHSSTAWGEPLVGDFNGDGADDLLDFNTFYGELWVSMSQAPSGTDAVVTDLWGVIDLDTYDPGSRAVGDFNDDGSDDVAAFSPNLGVWLRGDSAGGELEDTPTVIPDDGTVESTQSVTSDFGADVRIADVNVRLTITHTRADDLDVFLVGPNGSRVQLFTDVGGDSALGFTDTVFDDEALERITAGAAPFTGRFKPESGTLSAFDDILWADGDTQDWTLEITDDTLLNTGTLVEWELFLKTKPA